MIQVQNNQTGDIETLESDKDLPSLVQAGSVSIPQKDYEFETPEGEKYKVGAQGFLDAVKQGWKYRDQDILKQEELESKYGDETAKALLYGGLRGATFGISDAILTQTGAVEPEELSAIKELNPVASNVAEFGAQFAPALLSGGSTGIVSGVSKKLLPSLLNEASEYVGKRAAQNIAGNVAKRAIELGAAGAVEGAVMGVGQTISEAALGDAEFNAEALLSNVGTGALIGGGLGASLGAGIEYAKKATKFAKRQVIDTVVGQVDGDEALKNEVRKKLSDDQAIEEGLIALKDPEIERIKAEYPDAPISKGMESVYRPVKQAEDYLYDAPSLAGEEIRKKSNEVKEYVEKNVNEIWTGAREASPEEIGDLIRKTFFQNLNESREKGRAFYEDLMGEFGNAPVSDRYRTELSNMVRKSDAFRVGGEGSEIKRILGIVEDKSELLAKHAEELQYLGLNKRQISELRKSGGVTSKLNKELNELGINLKAFNDTIARHANELPSKNLTLKQIKSLQKDIGAKAKITTGEERALLHETYDHLQTMMNSIIKESVGESKAAQKIISGLEAANDDYKRAYGVKEEIAEIFGIKGADFDTVMEKLEKTSALDLEKKFLNVKKTDKAHAILEKYPEVGKLVLANRQRQLLNKNLTQNGVNWGGVKKDLLKMTPEERSLYFGGNKKQEKKLMDMLTLWEKRPKTLNPSGADIRNEVRNLLSPKQMMQNWALSEIYRGNESTLGKFVGKVLPTLGAVERSANKQKNTIASSVNKFFKATSVGVTLGSLELLSDKDLEKAKKSYETVQTNPEKLIENFVNNNRDLMDSAPQTANALQQRIVAGVQFLQSKVPHIDQEYIGEKIEPSKSELIRFNDYLDAVERPRVIFDQLKQGYVNPATIEALRTVYPKTFESVQAEVLARIPKTLTRAQKIQLQPLLGSKVTPAMDYKNLMFLQNKTQQSANANVHANAQTQHIPVSAAKNLKASNRSQTGLDKTLNRT